jgi:hypothetical protein
MMDKKEKTKIRVSLFEKDSGNAKCNAHDTGMQRSKTLSQEANKIAFRLARTPGAFPTFFSGFNILVARRWITLNVELALLAGAGKLFPLVINGSCCSLADEAPRGDVKPFPV